jgi:hypothetical protein
MKSRNADGDVPGLVDKQGEYMTVNLSLIVGHIGTAFFSLGVVGCWCYVEGV